MYSELETQVRDLEARLLQPFQALTLEQLQLVCEQNLRGDLAARLKLIQHLQTPSADTYTCDPDKLSHSALKEMILKVSYPEIDYVKIH